MAAGRNFPRGHRTRRLVHVQRQRAVGETLTLRVGRTLLFATFEVGFLNTKVKSGEQVSAPHRSFPYLPGFKYPPRRIYHSSKRLHLLETVRGPAVAMATI